MQSAELRHSTMCSNTAAGLTALGCSLQVVAKPQKACRLPPVVKQAAVTSWWQML